MKVFVDSIGCRLNQSEIEKIARQFRSAGHTVIADPAEADLVVVNTCTVTGAAASDSRQKIRQAARAGGARVVVTGCWATLEPQAAANLPHVTRVVPNNEKDHLVSQVLGLPQEDFDLEPLAREPLPGIHLRTRAFVKVQDGCDNHCTFCITRIARGEGRSEPIAAVVREIQAAVAGGTHEAVLSGVHLGSWGQDFSPSLHLRDLIQAILAETDIQRLRLSSLEPWDLDGEFFRLWEDPRMCRHLHLPLQSGSAPTLKRMARNTTPAAFADLVASARSAVPEMAITTDMIVGFPGEGEEEFQESLAFVREMRFAGGHVFSYSLRPGTAAAKLPGKVSGQVIHVRNHRMRAVFEEAGQAYREQFLGRQAHVLWESTNHQGPEGWRIHGLTDTYIRVETTTRQQLWNQVSQVRLTGLTPGGMEGQILPAVSRD
jgi:threonylcarbamoyladenosine tRNA methylthiotransferase MtaB